MVIAERNDQYFKKHPEKKQVVIEKYGKEKGKYLMPSIYDQPQSTGVFSKKEKTKIPDAKKASISNQRE